MNFDPDLCHVELYKSQKPLLSYKEECDYDLWKNSVRKMLTEVLGDMPEKVDLDITVEWEKEHDDFIERRILFTSEKNYVVPCHLCIPKKAKKPCPAIICLQGHTSGMHISLARKVHEADDDKTIFENDQDFAIQIVKQGYCALALEQRGFGERKSRFTFETNPLTGCQHHMLTALIQGRTLIGERVWDISRAIDMLETMPEVDSDKIGVMGNSGGGTATYYAACMDERIKIAMPSCSVCTFKHSILLKRHCECNYIPNIAKYVDMGDLACLIAPRKLVVVAGKEDFGFLIEGSREAYSTIEKIYKKAGAEGNCRLVEGDYGHRFYADLSWPVFNELAKWK